MWYWKPSGPQKSLCLVTCTGTVTRTHRDIQDQLFKSQVESCSESLGWSPYTLFTCAQRDKLSESMSRLTSIEVRFLSKNTIKSIGSRSHTYLMLKKTISACPCVLESYTPLFWRTSENKCGEKTVWIRMMNHSFCLFLKEHCWTLAKKHVSNAVTLSCTKWCNVVSKEYPLITWSWS